MKTLMVWILALVAAPALFAQNIVGTWQGQLQGPEGRPPLRIVIKISRADDESLKAVLYSIDQGGQPLTASSATQQGSTVKMTVAAIGGNFEGKLSGDGDSITGSWTQGGPTTPLNLTRATPTTAWEIPPPPPPTKLMPADAKPTFEVATIKPSVPDAPGQSILLGRGGSNLFTTTNSTLADLITFAYELHPRQLTFAPAWVESEKFDLSAKPDQPGMPSGPQLKTMVKQLLAERFQLTFHREKKELSVYALTVAKSGPKLNKSESTASLPGIGGRGPGSIGVRNATMAEFADFLQNRLVERPVVDQTGLPGRYDFTLKWTPDPGQLAAVGPNASPPPPADEDAPDLFGALVQQLGLKLEGTKAPVEVLVIDKVEKPSEN